MFVSSCHLTLFSCHVTRLGEESAEAMVIVGSFALFGEITIGLKKVHNVSYKSSISLSKVSCLPECHVRGSKAVYRFLISLCSTLGINKISPSPDAGNVEVLEKDNSGQKLTSQHEFAIWQPAWPTIRVKCQYQHGYWVHAAGGSQGARVVGSWRTVQADDFSHVCGW